MTSTFLKISGVVLMALMLTSCMTTQSRFSALDQSYTPKPEGYEVEVFPEGIPQRPFIKISRLDVHLEKSHFIKSSFEDALPELKKQARLSGADAIIEIRESTSRTGETTIYHVIATGIRFTN